MAGFSSALQLTDLDDFIGPSQACIKPQLTASSASAQASEPVAAPQPIKDASISLADCLACSGCVTTAETVLVTAQSVDEFLQRVQHVEDSSAASDLPLLPVVVVTLSPQSRASLAVHFGLSSSDVAIRLAHFFGRFGRRDSPLHRRFDVLRSVVGPDGDEPMPSSPDATANPSSRPAVLLDSNFGRAFSLVETAAEFRARLIANNKLDGQLPADTAAESLPLPMLCSACPGFVCYAEKKYGSDLIPHISTVRSPQQVMGSLVKRVLAPAVQLDAKDIYHIAIMPCFDKKLEASREEFQVVTVEGSPSSDVREVDCVLSTAEILDLLTKMDADLKNIDVTHVIPSTRSWFDSVPLAHGQPVLSERLFGDVTLSQRAGAGGAGGYLDFAFRDLAKELGHHEAVTGEIEFSAARRGNADYRVAHLSSSADKLGFAKAYGFRNVANVINKIKGRGGAGGTGAAAGPAGAGAAVRRGAGATRVAAGPAPPDFVEVMACPSGCTNGGGQVRVNAGSNDNDGQPSTLSETAADRESAKQRLARVEEAYALDATSIAFALDFPANDPEASRQAVVELYTRLVRGEPMSPMAKQLLHTVYNDRRSAIIGVNPLSVKW